ncbi:hypothetical protein [Rhizobium leguminosarum]|uniref:hypothetical protein n=1 Tax=Rhizobium leguminosarum TaxID=384 RepID=UPI00143F4374|nr:hypothetical protein [Rhizobium leguminosarum]NKL22952.1 hypothetical protein [Rhizobium leguminosarum bv. viciae]
MQFNDEATLTKPSALPVERRALVDHLREAIARLTHGLAAAGLVEFVPPLLEINKVLRDMTDEISRGDSLYSDEVITGTMRLIKTSEALLENRVIVQTIH